MEVVSIVLSINNPVSRAPFEVPFAWLFVFEIDSVTYFEGWCFSIHGFIILIIMFYYYALIIKTNI